MFSKKYIVIFHSFGYYDENIFINTIQSYKIWGRVSENSFIITSNEKPLEIHDRLIKCFPNGARLFVSKITSPAAWSNTICSSDWLQNNL